jgi:hypothetical protein
MEIIEIVGLIVKGIFIFVLAIALSSKIKIFHK